MRITVVKDDGIVAVDGVIRTVVLSIMTGDKRIIQWYETVGHYEYYDNETPNSPISDISEIQAYIDLWTAAAPPAPTTADLIAGAKARINASYDAAVKNLSINYPYGDREAMWLQEKEARAYQANNAATVPWLDAIAAERAMTKAEVASIVVGRANTYAADHGTYTGKQQDLIADIVALGPSPTQMQLDAIVWPS